MLKEKISLVESNWMFFDLDALGAGCSPSGSKWTLSELHALGTGCCEDGGDFNVCRVSKNRTSLSKQRLFAVGCLSNNMFQEFLCWQGLITSRRGCSQNEMVFKLATIG